MKKKTILYISDVTSWGGSSHSLINLICSLPEEVEPIVLLARKGEVYDYLQSLGVKCIVFRYVHNIALFRWDFRIIIHYIIHVFKYLFVNRICIYYVSRKLKGKVAIVHSNTSAVPIGQRIADNIGAKHIWQIREFIDQFHEIKIIGGRKNLQKQIYSSDAVVCISSPLVKYWGLENRKNVYVLWNAVRSVNEKIYIHQKKNYFLFCCTGLCDYKGADFATMSFCKSLLFKKFKLYFVGGYSEEYKEKLLSIARPYGAEKSLVFLGFQKESEIKRYYSKAMAFMQCSKIEGLGRTAIEAMFFGCPVVARNNGGTTDFIVNGKNGFLFNTEEECIELLKYVVEHPMDNIIREAMRTATEGFSTEEYGNKIMDIYTDVLSQMN